MTHSRSTKIIIRMSAALKTCSRAGGSRPGLAKTASSRRDTRAWWRTTNPRINSWLETEGKCRSLAKITALTRKATRELQNLWLRHVERCKQIHSHLMKHDSDQSWIFRKKIRPNLQGPYFGQRVQEKKNNKTDSSQSDNMRPVVNINTCTTWDCWTSTISYSTSTAEASYVQKIFRLSIPRGSGRNATVNVTENEMLPRTVTLLLATLQTLFRLLFNKAKASREMQTLAINRFLCQEYVEGKDLSWTDLS